MKVLPILAEHLPEVGQFLHEQLNRRFSAERWISSVSHAWAENVPNFGMQLRDEERLVGVFCAIYSDQIIDGKLERFCNPHSWCVLPTHRQHGIGLLLKLIKQSGYHFTMFTPNPTVTKVFLGLKFANLDDRQYVCFNLPSLVSLASLRRGAFAESEPERIAMRLQGQDLSDFNAHKAIPWLNFVAFGVGDEVCWVVYKPIIWKRMRSAWIMHVSDADVFGRWNAVLRNHLLRQHGFVTLNIEARWLRSRPAWSLLQRRLQPKLFKSATLAATQVRDLYSELVTLDV